MHDGSATTIHDLLDRLQQHWMEMGIKPRPGVSDAQIVEFCSRHDVRLPPDVEAYFRRMNGVEDGQVDSDMILFHPLEHLEQATEILWHEAGSEQCPDPENFYVVADYFIWQHGYAVRLTRDAAAGGEVIALDQRGCVPVARSFPEFLTLYLDGTLLDRGP